MAVDRRLWLGAMLGVAVVAAIVVRSADNAPATTAAPAARPAARGSQAAGGGAGQPPLQLDLDVLSRERGEPAEGGRNPFTFRPKPAPPPPPAPSRPANQPTVTGPVAPIAPPGPPPPPPITLKFIGTVQKADGTKFAILSDGKGPIYGNEGAEIAGRYKIWKIGMESIEISYLDGRGRQTLRMSGK